jgi:hypothetical protein
VSGIEVEVERSGSRDMRLRFFVTGWIDEVALPPFSGTSARRDELWKHTCFEAFIQTEGGYREFNLSPSGQWASYRFSGYREDMADAAEIARIAPLDLAEDGIVLDAAIDLPSPVGRMGLSAVIEALDGSKTYWALTHPSDTPDFHHQDSFVLDPPPPEPA